MASPDALARLAQLATPRLNRYIPIRPHPRQALFMMLPHKEALYGGAAGGAKTWALLASALQYVDVPGYSAILFRRTFPELAAAEGLIPLSKRWLGPTDAVYNEAQHAWTFPGGATLRFGHMQHLKDIERHERGPAYQFIGFDELTTFARAMYRRMFSRLRGPANGPLSKIPWRMRGATNPGGEGHAWVKQHFLAEGRDHGRPFVRARLQDNPDLDAKRYVESLAELDPVTRARMLEGDWEIQEGGEFFDRGWFRILDEAPAVSRKVRFWDCAATTSESSAYTAGVLMGRTLDGAFLVLDVQRFKRRSGERDELILAQAHQDGSDVEVLIEQEPGSGGLTQVEAQVRMLAGFNVQAVKPLGSKPERAAPLASQAKVGNVSLLSGPWIGEFLDEVQGFPGGRYKDQVDAAAGALVHLAQVGTPGAAVGGSDRRGRTAASGIWKQRRGRERIFGR